MESNILPNCTEQTQRNMHASPINEPILEYPSFGNPWMNHLNEDLNSNTPYIETLTEQQPGTNGHNEYKVIITEEIDTGLDDVNNLKTSERLHELDELLEIDSKPQDDETPSFAELDDNVYPQDKRMSILETKVDLNLYKAQEQLRTKKADSPSLGLSMNQKNNNRQSKQIQDIASTLNLGPNQKIHCSINGLSRNSFTITNFDNDIQIIEDDESSEDDNPTPFQPLQKNHKRPTLLDFPKIERDFSMLSSNKISRNPTMTSFKFNPTMTSLKSVNKKSDFENNGVYSFQKRQSGTDEHLFFAGEPVQEMLDPGRTKGCYFTVDKSFYPATDDMVRGFSAQNQIGLIPHKHANPEIYITTDNTTFCGVNKQGKYSNINLAKNVLVLIDSNAIHGIRKEGAYRIEKFSSQFYFVFPKQKDKVIYVKCDKDMSAPERDNRQGFDGVEFYDQESLASTVDISVDSEEKLKLGNDYKEGYKSGLNVKKSSIKYEKWNIVFWIEEESNSSSFHSLES